MADVYTIKASYEGCESRIWRELQISSNAPLCQLGYTVLATFDTMAYHLFSISYDGTSYGLPNEDTEISENECLFCVKLSDLDLQVGSRLEMVYDFGCEQVFSMEVTDVQPMKGGAGRAYPKIISGAGCGIVEDMSSDELLEVKRILTGTGVPCSAMKRSDPTLHGITGSTICAWTTFFSKARSNRLQKGTARLRRSCDNSLFWEKPLRFPHENTDFTTFSSTLFTA